jgi:glycosyltransferase involved in cell wall biosynthesis
VTVQDRTPPCMHNPPATGDIVEALVSVLLPVRNGMPYLPQAIESLLAQTYSNLEIIVIDDGSSDETPQYLRSRLDSRLKCLSTDAKSGSGIANALNLGIAHSRGEFVARQDADDISRPDRIERQVEYLRNNLSIDVVATQAEYIDESGGVTENSWTREVRLLHDPAGSPQQLAELLPLTCCLIHGTVVIRRSVLQQVGGYDRRFEWAEDYDLWLRLLPEHRIAKIPERLYRYRIHSEQISDHRPREQTKFSIRAKLAYLRRMTADLPKTARVWVQGKGLGAQLYRELLPEYNLVESNPGHGSEPVLSAGIAQILTDACHRNCDLLIITDFTLIDPIGRPLASSVDNLWSIIGNFFVRRR